MCFTGDGSTTKMSRLVWLRSAVCLTWFGVASSSRECMHPSRTAQTFMLPSAILSCRAAPPTYYAAQPTYSLHKCLPPPTALHLPLDINIVLHGAHQQPQPRKPQPQQPCMTNASQFSKLMDTCQQPEARPRWFTRVPPKKRHLAIDCRSAVPFDAGGPAHSTRTPPSGLSSRAGS